LFLAAAVLVSAVLVPAASVVAPTPAAAASGAKVSAHDYAAALCGRLSGWIDDIKHGSDTLSSGLGSKGPRPAKALLVTFLQNTTNRTTRLVHDVDAIGVPAVDNGRAIASGLHNGLAKARDIFRSSLADAKKLSTSSEAKFSQGASRIGAELDRGSTQVSAALSSVGANHPSPDLEAAMSAEPLCAALGVSGSSGSSTTTS
jgi:hypothetical protein